MQDKKQLRKWWFDLGGKLVKCGEKSKLPKVKWGVIAKNPQTLEEAEAQFYGDENANLAVLYSEAWLVLDPENEDAANKLVEKIPELENTLWFKTGNGRQYFVRKPEDFEMKIGMFINTPWDEEVKDEDKQVEIRYSTRKNPSHYSLVPYSTHPNGKQYSFGNQTAPIEIEGIEEKILELAKENGWRFAVDKRNVKNTKEVEANFQKKDTSNDVLAFYERLKAAVSLKQVAPKNVVWQGNLGRGPCPKHGVSKSHPLPCQYYETGNWVCYSTKCGEAGDAIRCYQFLKNISKYHDAALELAKEYSFKDDFLTEKSVIQPLKQPEEAKPGEWKILDSRSSAPITETEEDGKESKVVGDKYTNIYYSQTDDGILSTIEVDRVYKNGGKKDFTTTSKTEYLARCKLNPICSMQLPQEFSTDHFTRHVEVSIENLKEEEVGHYRGKASGLSDYIQKNLAISDKPKLSNAISILLHSKITSGDIPSITAYPSVGIFPAGNGVVFVAGENSIPSQIPILCPNPATELESQQIALKLDASKKEDLPKILDALAAQGDLYNDTLPQFPIIAYGWMANGYLGYLNRKMFKFQPILSFYGKKNLGKTVLIEQFGNCFGRQLKSKDAVGSEFRAAVQLSTGGIAPVDEAARFFSVEGVGEMVKSSTTSTSLTDRGNASQEIKRLNAVSLVALSSNEHPLELARDIGGGLESRLVILGFPEELRIDFKDNNKTPVFNNNLQIILDNGNCLGVALGQLMTEEINKVGLKKYQADMEKIRDLLTKEVTFDNRKMMGYVQILHGLLALAKLYKRAGKELPTWLKWLLTDYWADHFLKVVQKVEEEAEESQKQRGVRFLQYVVASIQKFQAGLIESEFGKDREDTYRRQFKTGVYGIHLDNYHTPTTITITKNVLQEFNKELERSKIPPYSQLSEVGEDVLQILNKKRAKTARHTKDDVYKNARIGKSVKKALVVNSDEVENFVSGATIQVTFSENEEKEDETPQTHLKQPKNAVTAQIIALENNYINGFVTSVASCSVGDATRKTVVEGV